MSARRDAILIVFPFSLDAIGHGNVQRTLALSRSIIDAGFEVDVIYPSDAASAADAVARCGFRRILRVDPNALSSEADAWQRRLESCYEGLVPPAAIFQPKAPFAAAVRSVIESQNYRAIVASYAWTAPIFEGLDSPPKLICDLHDIMHHHGADCRRTGSPATTFDLDPETEAALWSRWDSLLAITQDDASAVRSAVSSSQSVAFVPHASDIVSQSQPGGGKDVLYVASANASNVAAATWLLDLVWPRVSAIRPEARLRIAGPIGNVLLESHGELAGVEILGVQAQLAPLVNEAAVCVAPYVYGSGLKIKVVEAACQGKALIATSRGIEASGLVNGHDVIVEDDPARFAEAITRLLDDASTRSALGARALGTASRLFRAPDCYEPLFGFITTATTRPLVHDGELSQAVIDRVRIATAAEGDSRVVAWGNGQHTRHLLSTLARSDMTVDLIVDGRATVAAIGPEGVPVVPAAQYFGSASLPGDIVVLSSEVFEPQMWADLADWREHGGSVLALYHPQLVSDGLSSRLAAGHRAALGLQTMARRTSTSPSTTFLWDSQANRERWWRCSHLIDLAFATTGPSCLIVPQQFACFDRTLRALPPSAAVAPLLDLDFGRLEERAVSGGLFALNRLTELAGSMALRALLSADLRTADSIRLVGPALSELFGLAEALMAHPVRPAIVLDMTAAQREHKDWMCLTTAARQAYWRLATTTLEAGARSLQVVAAIDDDCRHWQAILGRRVRRIAAPVVPPGALRSDDTPHDIVCIGNVAVAGVASQLASIADRTGANIAWRSDDGNCRYGIDDRWAAGLATQLGIRLLDSGDPLATRIAISNAREVVRLDPDDSAPWSSIVNSLTNTLVSPQPYGDPVYATVE